MPRLLPSRALRRGCELFSLPLCVALLLLCVGDAFAQQMVGQPSAPAVAWRSCAANLIVPQSRTYWRQGNVGVVIEKVVASVDIQEQTAVTTLDVFLYNPTPSSQEAELLIPVVPGAVIRDFDFEGSTAEPKVDLLAHDVAQRTYEGIVAQLRDPALLEFAGYASLRSSVFPVAAQGRQRIRLSWEQLLKVDGQRVDYILPRSETVRSSVPWSVHVSIDSKAPITTVYSPTHKLVTRRIDDSSFHLTAGVAEKMQSGPFSVSYLREDKGVTASFLAYPDASVGGGYFLLLAGLPVESLRPHQEAIKREVTLVFDRSGSMQGSKLAQAKAAALQVLEGLDAGESFNVISYSDSVESLSPRSWVKNAETLAEARGYIQGISAGGGTNLHAALQAALEKTPAEGTLPIVLFLTDGLATVGEVSEVAIRKVAVDENPHRRRVFTFGVGADVNTPLLERIASASRAVPTFVLPNESVESKVSQVFKRLRGPVLSEPRLQLADVEGRAPRMREVLPAQLADLFMDDQLVVLGQYVGDEPLQFRLEGNFLGKQRAFEFEFSLDKATTRNGVVPRLWASRKIGVLVDAVRQLGADNYSQAQQAQLANDPKMEELVGEIVRLSTKHGVLTEYTAFLAYEGTDLANVESNFKIANGNLITRGVGCRTGWGAVNQSQNGVALSAQSCLNVSNEYLDKNLNTVEVTTVQQLSDLTFYRRGSRWVDSRAIDNKGAPRVVLFGSDEFSELLDRLTLEGRQGCMGLSGEILLSVDGQPVLLRAEAEAAVEAPVVAPVADGMNSNGTTSGTAADGENAPEPVLPKVGSRSNNVLDWLGDGC